MSNQTTEQLLKEIWEMCHIWLKTFIEFTDFFVYNKEGYIYTNQDIEKINDLSNQLKMLRSDIYKKGELLEINIRPKQNFLNHLNTFLQVTIVDLSVMSKIYKPNELEVLDISTSFNEQKEDLRHGVIRSNMKVEDRWVALNQSYARLLLKILTTKNIPNN